MLFAGLHARLGFDGNLRDSCERKLESLSDCAVGIWHSGSRSIILVREVNALGLELLVIRHKLAAFVKRASEVEQSRVHTGGLDPVVYDGMKLVTIVKRTQHDCSTVVQEDSGVEERSDIDGPQMPGIHAVLVAIAVKKREIIATIRVQAGHLPNSPGLSGITEVKNQIANLEVVDRLVALSLRGVADTVRLVVKADTSIRLHSMGFMLPDLRVRVLHQGAILLREVPHDCIDSVLASIDHARMGLGIFGFRCTDGMAPDCRGVRRVGGRRWRCLVRSMGKAN